MILISACLCGIPCRYDGKSQPNAEAVRLVSTGKALPVCPECLGGLPIPRISCEIVGGSGEDVLAGSAKVIANAKEGPIDMTDKFIKGAYLCLQAARDCGADTVMLKANSPSCGCGRIYDGTFSGAKRDGDGVATALLRAVGLNVIEV